MKQTAPFVVQDLVSESDVRTLLDYIALDDDRTDARPDVRSKHPHWDEPGWPQDIIESALNRAVGAGFVIDEITFRQDRIGLKPHTDDGHPEGAVGKNMMILLDAQPASQTIFFTNRWPNNTKYGAFFTRTPWNPFLYKLPNRQGEMIEVDLRDLQQICETDPASVDEFEVTDGFRDLLRSLIQKRGLPKLDFDTRDQTTGYMQPGLRVSCFEELTDYKSGRSFDTDFHAQYLSDIPIQDLEGLTVEQVIEWQPGAAIVFDRDQLHCSSSNHHQKSFITIFYHHPPQ